MAGHLQDLQAVSIPEDVPWAAAGWPNWLLSVFDWDIITLNQTSTMQTVSIQAGVALCTSFFPCSVFIRGSLPQGNVEVSGSGSISCFSGNGCETIRIEGVSFVCNENRKDSTPMFKIQGSTLDIFASSFIGCRSDTDGGLIQAYDLADVSIQSCHFHGILSRGFGGAVAAFGSNLKIVDSIFTNCLSNSGGGAVWASAYEGCYGSMTPYNTVLDINSTVFKECSTQGSGGAILANSAIGAPGSEILDVVIKDTTFVNCSAGADGGALQTAGVQVVSRIESTRFDSCQSTGSGGAISAVDSSSLSLIKCCIANCYAGGLGGGALYLKASIFLSYNVSLANNAAPYGGGGALFWQLSLRPANLGCPPGTHSINTSCPLLGLRPSALPCIMGSCKQCAPGTYQTSQNAVDCIPCPLGTFSQTIGSLSCNSCQAGSYSSLLGANSSEACSLCPPGKYSDSSGMSDCNGCVDGTYSVSPGSVTCRSCESGFYSGPQGGWCSRCVLGLYTGASYLSQHSILNFSQCPLHTSGNGTIGRLVLNGTYGNNELMFWVIAPSLAGTGVGTKIELKFSMFETEINRDFVSLYSCLHQDCNASSLTKLGTFSGLGIPSIVTCDSSVMLVVWNSDRNTTGTGWSAQYRAYRLENSSLRVMKNEATSSTIRSVDLPVLMHRKTLIASDSHLESGNNPPEQMQSARLRKGAGLRRSGPLHPRTHVRDFPQICHLSARTNSRGSATPMIEPNSASSARISAYSATVYLKGLRSTSTRNAVILRRSVEVGHVLTKIGCASAGFSEFCGTNNSALYGACVASGYARLAISFTTDHLYAGVAFNLTVKKLDVYGNTILSDSTSVLQAIVTSNRVIEQRSEATDSVAIVGPSLAQISKGVATFLFAVEPTFSDINLLNGSAKLSGQIYFYLNGSDSQAGIVMISDAMQLNLEQGQTVCPAGYILMLSEKIATQGPAVCQFCKPGTYSLRPLAHMPGSALTPSCIICPAAGVCTKGGDDVSFKVGTWVEVGGIYMLTSCPEGFELINSTDGTSQGQFSNDVQECRACLPEQYILNPNTDSCQNCPPGLICTGTSVVVPVIKGSIWIRESTIYRLIGCPAGYSISAQGVLGSFDPEVQQCSPCPKGEECISPPCTGCKPCKPGFYKASAGVDSCVACPVDTYSTETGGQSLSACQRCPTHGSTQGHINQTSQDNCLCDIGYYPVHVSAILTCVLCPTGATCPDGSCALSNPSLLCPEGSSIVGDWTLDNNSGFYVLNGCPAGYYLNAAKCQLCPASYYCSGGSLPSTPCASGTFSIPRSTSKDNCSTAVFVVLVINLPILRPFFTDETNTIFQNALAHASFTDLGHIIVDIIQPGNNPSTTDVTSRIAVLDASAAAALVKKLNSTNLQADFVTHGFHGVLLTSVQVTACIAGYELQTSVPPSTCQICQANYYCLGGTNARIPCPNGGFSAPAANSSSVCTQAAIVLVIGLPLLLSNFTADLRLTFIHALAMTAGVPASQVAILSVANAPDNNNARREMEVPIGYNPITTQRTLISPGKCINPNLQSELSTSFLLFNELMPKVIQPL